MRKYILKDRNPVLAADDDYSGFAEENRRVGSTSKDGVLVSTVFLALDHAFGGGKPILFETMIFGGEHDQYQDRCSTWEEAEAMHTKACELVGLPSPFAASSPSNRKE